MPKKEKACVCKNCGYVLLEKDAVVSGWDAEGSLRHVHCPRCGKNGERKRAERHWCNRCQEELR